MNAQQLMDRHGAALIAILKNASPALQGAPEVAAFLNRVLDDEEQVALMPPHRPALPGEEVFWWCVEQLLLLCELARPAQDPYLQMALADLRAFAGRLERCEPLPSGYRVDWLDAGDGLCTAGPTGLECVRTDRIHHHKDQPMKLYDTPMAPNPRRVRIFMAEKGISCETVEINIVKGENLGDAYLAVNPRGLLPALVLDDGAVIDESVAICRYLEETHPQPPLMGTDPLSKARIEARQRHMEFDGLAGAADVFRNSFPGFAKRGLPGAGVAVDAIPALAERGRTRVRNFYQRLNQDLQDSEFVAGDAFSIADITGLCAVDFAVGAARMPIPEDCVNLKRWHALVSARPSAAA